MKNNKTKISYEPEADVLTWEINRARIDYAREIGNIVVHFTKGGIPVLVEILEATSFLARAQSLVTRRSVLGTKIQALATG